MLRGISPSWRPRTNEGSATTSCIMELNDRPFGYLQFYRWSDHPDAVRDMGIGPVGPGSFGLDIFVGEPDLVEKGLGTEAVEAMCSYLASDLGATEVILATELINHRAQRCYEKAGFVKVRQILDTDTRDGERLVCWLMRWRPTPIIHEP